METRGYVRNETEMQWEMQDQQQQLQQQQSSNGVGGLYVKVMTDEQMEVLRKQISVYASICEQLVEMHKSVTAHQDLAGLSTSLIDSPPYVYLSFPSISPPQSFLLIHWRLIVIVKSKQCYVIAWVHNSGVVLMND